MQELDGEDLQMGEVIYFNPDGTIQKVGNFHNEVLTVSGTYCYAEPNVSDFLLVEGGVKWALVEKKPRNY